MMTTNKNQLIFAILAIAAGTLWMPTALAQNSCGASMSLQPSIDTSSPNELVFTGYEEGFDQGFEETVLITMSPGAPDSQALNVEGIDFGLTCANNRSNVPCRFGNDEGQSSGTTPVQYVGLVDTTCADSVDEIVVTENALDDDGNPDEGLVRFDFPVKTIPAGESCFVQIAVSAQDRGTDDSPLALTSAAGSRGVCPANGLIGDASGSVAIFLRTVPDIRLLKEISIDGGNTWFDANVAEDTPWAEVESGAQYRLTATNTGMAVLNDVTINDPTLGITDYGVGSLDIDETVVIDASEIAALSQSLVCDSTGTFENTADVTATSADDGQVIGDTDPANLFCVDLDVEKTADALGKVGDTVDYTVSLINNNGFALENCTADDSLLGTVFGPGATLPDGSTLLNLDREVEDGDPNPLINEVTLTCDAVGPVNTVALSDDDQASTEVINPAVSLTKSGPTTAKVGDTFDYTILVESTGTGTLETCTVTDPLLGGDLGTFVPGDPQTFAFTPEASDLNEDGQIINTASVTCGVAGFNNEVDAEDSHTVEVINPAIAVTKIGPATAKVGDEITYTIGFESTGTGVVENCTGTDTLLGDLGAFDAGENKTFDRTVEADDPNPLPNTATITCDVADFENAVTDSDSHSVELFNPGIVVTKEGPETAKVGDVITYTIGFTNSGDAEVSGCTGTDTLLGDLGAFDAGVNKTFDRTVEADDPNPLPNTATITCDVAGFDNQASASDDHVVDLIDPSIDVTKEGPETAKVGDVVTYTIGFTNSGDAKVSGCTGTDTLLGDLGTFEAGVKRTFEREVTADDPNPLPNTATITCDVAGLDNQVLDSAEHSVQLISPAVSIAKSCSPDPVAVGDTIEWTIDVTNDGDAELDCLVNDAEAGIVDEPLLLAATESDTLTASRIVESDDFPTISNTASVSCSVAGFDNGVDAEATADCEVEQEQGEEICRTPGFWGTHAGTEKRRSSDLAQAAIDAAGGELSICGQTIDNTNVDNVNSAVEAMCVRVQGEQQRQLARQLTAMSLNCIVSGGTADCTGTSVDSLFDDANDACTIGGGGPELGPWIDRVDCFNNGGQFDEAAGECRIDGSDPNNCQNRELDESTDIFDEISPLPGPAGSSRACSSARRNGIEVVPF